MNTFFSFLIILLLPLSLVAQMPAFDSLALQQSQTVYFDFGKYTIPPHQDTVLAPIITMAQQLSVYQIHIEAHTDSIGNPENNRLLSQKRAQAVKDFMLQKGLNLENAIHTTPYGESQPDTDNSTEAKRQLNRRATIKLYQKTPMTLLEGHIVNQKTGEGIQATVVLHSKTNRDTLQTLPSGKFQHLVPEDIVLGVDVFAKGYFFDTQMLKTKKDAKTSLNIKLHEAKKGEIVPIKNLYFVGNKAVLLPVSGPQLPNILRFMQVNDSLSIEIAGHINRPYEPPVAKDSHDFKLSVRRAKLVYDYLVENGIDPIRISYQGYGNSEMRFPKANSLKQQSLNRRVEIRILD